MQAKSRGTQCGTLFVIFLFTAALLITSSLADTCSLHCDGGCAARPGSCNQCNYGYGLDTAVPRQCQPCDPNCDTSCYNAGYNKCDGFCKSGYKFNGITKKCDPNGGVTQAPISCPSQCASCLSSGSCSRCNNGYGLTAQSQCAACDSNCAGSCSNSGAGKCDGPCKPGYQLSNNQCQVSLSCSQYCSAGCSVQNSCNRCDNGYGFTSDSPPRCSACDSNCAGYCSNSGAGKCDGPCKSGYQLNNNQCQSSTPTTCSDHCSKGCAGRGAGSCDICDDGYGLNNAAKAICLACDPKCTNGCTRNGADRCDGSCASGFTFDDSTKICTKNQQPGNPVCDPNCDDACDTAGYGKCNSRCKSGYTLDANHYCKYNSAINCSPYCKAGCVNSGSGKCDVCDSGFGLINGICNPCDFNCISQCSQSGGGKCDTGCKPGFILDTESKTCKRCDTKCKSGCQSSGPGKCDGDCQPNYGPVGPSGSKTCSMCSKNCATGCNRNGGGSCDQCVNGYGLSDTSPRICQLCDLNCADVCTTSGAGKCDSRCRPGYALDPSSKTCKVSSTSNNPYPDCDPHCTGGCSLTGPGKCDGACFVNYGKTGSKSCGLCAEDCVGGCMVNGAGACDQCSPGYGKVDQQPRTCRVCDSNCADVCGTAGAGKCDNLCSVNYVLMESKVCNYVLGKASVRTGSLLLTGSIAGFLLLFLHLFL